MQDRSETSALLPSSWTAIGKIHSAEAKLELDHACGRLTLEAHFFEGTPAIIARLDFLSPELEKHSRHSAFQPCDLPLLLRHAARVLEEAIEHTGSDEQNSDAVG